VAQEAEQQRGEQGREMRTRLIADQLPQLSARALLLRSALTALYVAIGLLVVTSIAVGLVSALSWSYGWIPVVTGMCGAATLLYGSLLLVREARLAIGSTLQEMDYLRAVVDRSGD
jgi:hypothetical protein